MQRPHLSQADPAHTPPHTCWLFFLWGVQLGGAIEFNRPQLTCALKPPNHKKIKKTRDKMQPPCLPHAVPVHAPPRTHWLLCCWGVQLGRAIKFNHLVAICLCFKSTLSQKFDKNARNKHSRPAFPTPFLPTPLRHLLIVVSLRCTTRWSNWIQPPAIYLCLKPPLLQIFEKSTWQNTTAPPSPCHSCPCPLAHSLMMVSLKCASRWSD